MVIKPDFEENRANLEKGRVKIDLVIKEEGGTHLFAPSLGIHTLVSDSALINSSSTPLCAVK